MGLTIGVSAASGGLGASTLVAALAMRAGSLLDGCATSVGVDLDPRGGLETTMCLEHLEGARWEDVEAVDWGRSDLAHPVHVEDLPGAERVHVLGGSGAGPLEWSLVGEVLAALAATVDLVVVDCGHRPPAAVLSRLDLIVVLARTTARGVADLVVLRDRGLARTNPLLVTRASRRDRHGPALAREVRLPFLAHLPDDSAVLRHERDGIPPGALPSAVGAVADEVLTVVRTAPLSARFRQVAPPVATRGA
jgi:hypothetical protein